MRPALRILFLFILCFALLVCAVSAFDNGTFQVGDFTVSPFYEPSSEISDGLEVTGAVTHFTIPENHVSISGIEKKVAGIALFYNFFVNTPFRDVARSFTPILFVLMGVSGMGCFFIFRFAKREHKNTEVSDMIVRYLIAHPGVSQVQIIAATGISRGSVSYHLSRLISARLVYTTALFGHPRYYFHHPAESGGSDIFAALDENPRCHEIFSILYVHPGMTREEIAREMDMKPNAVFRYLKIMTQAEVVVRLKDVRQWRYAMSDETKMMWQRGDRQER